MRSFRSSPSVRTATVEGATAGSILARTVAVTDARTVMALMVQCSAAAGERREEMAAGVAYKAYRPQALLGLPQGGIRGA